MTETPAAFLRRAAAHGRTITARIAVKAPAPWLSLDDGDRLVHDPGHQDGPPVYVVPEPLDAPDAAEHFALMDPAVAEGVYASLEAAADDAEMCDRINARDPDNPGKTRVMYHPLATAALTVARALLREPAPAATEQTAGGA